MGIETGTALLLSAIVGAGAAAYSATQTPDAPTIQQAETPQITDKTVAQTEGKLDEAAAGDESTKRKKQGTKAKFKVDAPATTGLNTDAGGVPGVQI